jgi:hypothetical protein
LIFLLAWKKVVLDLVVGTEKPNDTYWARMKEFFDAGKIVTFTKWCFYMPLMVHN